MATSQRQSNGEVDVNRTEEVASLRDRLEEMTREKEELRGIADASRQEVFGTLILKFRCLADSKTLKVNFVYTVHKECVCCFCLHPLPAGCSVQGGF